MVLSYHSWEDFQGLHIVNTECRTTLEPKQTIFFFPCSPDDPSVLLSEPYNPAPLQDELMAAPFYPDPSQRVLVLCSDRDKCFAINTEQLLKHAQKWQDQRVDLYGWSGIMEFEIGDLYLYDVDYMWVSGCRLFSLVRGSMDHNLPLLQVHDFSYGGHSRNHGVSQGRREGGVSSSAHIGSHGFPWVAQKIINLTFGHDGIIFCTVGILTI